MPDRAKSKALLWAIEAGLALIAAQFVIRFVPFRYWSRHARSEIDPAVPPPTHAILRRAEGVGRRVDRIANRLPWRSKCLARALAAHTLLTRRNIPARLVVGARRNQDSTGRFDLHAWTVVDKVIVIGAENGAPYSAFRQAS